jgi:hypothetical protein
VGIVDRSETAPADPAAEIPEEVEADGKPIKGTGRAANAASRAYTDYNWRFWEALRLIFESLEEGIQSNYMTITHPADLWEATKRDCWVLTEKIIAIESTICGEGNRTVEWDSDTAGCPRSGSTANRPLHRSPHKTASEKPTTTPPDVNWIERRLVKGKITISKRNENLQSDRLLSAITTEKSTS